MQLHLFLSEIFGYESHVPAVDYHTLPSIISLDSCGFFNHFNYNFYVGTAAIRSPVCNLELDHLVLFT